MARQENLWVKNLINQLNWENDPLKFYATLRRRFCAYWPKLEGKRLFVSVHISELGLGAGSLIATPYFETVIPLWRLKRRCLFRTNFPLVSYVTRCFELGRQR